MGIIVDLIICSIFFGSIFMGYRKGLVNVILKVCAFFIALIITAILFHPISLLIINNTEIDEKVEATLIENLKKENEEENENNNLTTKMFEKHIGETIDKTQESVVENAAKSVSKNVINVITAIIVFVVIRVILIFLSFILEGIAELPIIKQFNKLGGVGFGIIRGLVVIYILLAIIFFIASIGGVEVISKIINETYITKVLYSNNIILKILL